MMELDIHQYETKSRFVNDIIELRRFDTILNFELSTAAAFILQSFFPMNIYIIVIAAILFTPYMLFVLFKVKKYGWITFFFLLVVLPYPVTFLIIGDYILLPAWLLLPIIPFYLYCFLIKYSVSQWLQEYNAEQHLAELRKDQKKKEKEWLL